MSRLGLQRYVNKCVFQHRADITLWIDRRCGRIEYIVAWWAQMERIYCRWARGEGDYNFCINSCTISVARYCTKLYDSKSKIGTFLSKMIFIWAILLQVDILFEKARKSPKKPSYAPCCPEIARLKDIIGCLGTFSGQPPKALCCPRKSHWASSIILWVCPEVSRRARERLIHEYFFLMQLDKLWPVFLGESKFLATCLSTENTRRHYLGLWWSVLSKLPRFWFRIWTFWATRVLVCWY